MSISKLEKQAVQWLIPFLPENPVIFDVGSNKGEWSDIIMEEFGDRATFHFFEPNDIMLNYTKIKYDYNTNIWYQKVAVAKTIGWEPFTYFENFNNGLSSLYRNPKWNDLPWQEKKVPTISIDEYCKIGDVPIIDFIKIDVEGAEGDVLEGMQKMLSNNKVRFIQLEYSEHWPLSGTLFAKVIAAMGYYGYTCYSFNGENFVKLEAGTFVEDYRYENFYITKANIINHSHGWNKTFIENTADIKIDFALEIGSCEGLTAKYMCENMISGRLICVDPLEDYYLKPGDMPELVDQHQRWLRNTRGLPVNLYRKKFDEAYEELKQFRFGFIYVDGDHTEDVVYNDAKLAFSLCERKGNILFDDYDVWSEGTKRGIDKFLREYAAQLYIVKKNYQVLIMKI